MSISRIAVVSLCLAVVAAPSCSGKDADLACFESWNSDSTGARWLTDCSCADWSLDGGRPVSVGTGEVRLVAKCQAGVVPVEGPNPQGYGDSDMVCCKSNATVPLCECVRRSDGCAGQTLYPTCTTSGAGPGSGGSGECTSEEPHTTYASCTTDGDCYSGYCNDACKPGPCCEVATDTVRDQGRSYDCASDADCAAVAPDFVARGGVASCVRPGNTMVHEVCTFDCPTP